MGPILVLTVFVVVVFALLRSAGHRVYRVLIRRRQVGSVRAALARAAADARADQARRGAG